VVHGLSLATITGRCFGETPFLQVSRTLYTNCAPIQACRPPLSSMIWSSCSRLMKPGTNLANSMICCTSSVNLAADSAHSSARLYTTTINITSQSRSHQHQLLITCPTPATAPHCSSVTNISGLLLWLK